MNYVQGSPEWLEMRKNHIMASDAPIIMGDSPWKTPLQLWEEKLGLKQPPKANFAMMRGNELEPIAREAYNNHTGLYAEPEVVFHPEKKWMGASLDGISFDRSIIVEIKCPGEKDHILASEGKVPTKYYAQLQHQLATIEADLLHYFSYRHGDFFLIEVQRDKEYIEQMLEAEEIFWKQLQDFEPPALEDGDVRVKTDSKWEILAEEWTKNNLTLKECKEKDRKLRELLVQEADGQACEGFGVRAQKVIRKGSIDYSLVEQLDGIDLNRFRKPPVESWRIC